MNLCWITEYDTSTAKAAAATGAKAAPAAAQ